ncbi:hypothetical protein NP234_24070, partial [Salmonella enterica]|nr:hypothetical protein [Salmonella enterica]
TAAAAALALASCGGSDNTFPPDAMTADSLLYVAEVYVGDSVTLRGTAIIRDGQEGLSVADSALTCEIHVETPPGADIRTGQHVVVRGLLHEERTSASEVDAKVAEVDSLFAAGLLSADVRQKTLNALSAKKAYMEYSGRAYYSVFSLRGAKVIAQ